MVLYPEAFLTASQSLPHPDLIPPVICPFSFRPCWRLARRACKTQSFPILHPPTCHLLVLTPGWKPPQSAGGYLAYRFGRRCSSPPWLGQFTLSNHAGTAVKEMSPVIALTLNQSVAQFPGIASQWLLFMELHGVVPKAYWTQAHGSTFSLMIPPAHAQGFLICPYPDTSHSGLSFLGQGDLH